MSAPLPHEHESARIAVLKACGVLDTAPEAEFDGLVALASAVSECPIALVSLVDEARQWFKARVGLDATQTPRDISFCGHTVLSRDSKLVVNDAKADPRFASNPLVTGAPHVAFYAGFALKVGPERLPVGTLCVIAPNARELTERQAELLQVIAHQVEVLLEGRLRARDLENAMRQLTGTEARLHAIVDSMHDGVVFQEQGGAISWSNASACRILGLTADQLAGRTSVDPRWRAIREDGSPLEGQDHPAMVTLRTGKPVIDMVMGLGIGDQERWICTSSQPLFHQGHTVPWAAVTTFCDVTEIRARQRALEEATAQAQAAGRAKSEFLATMSHELRTPMNGVIGLTDLMLTDAEHPLDGAQHERLLAIKDSGRMLLTVINDVLDFSKIEAGGRTFVTEVIDPLAQASDVVRMLGQDAARRGLSLEVFKGPAPLVMGDGEAVRQVLFNLVGNALKFTAHGSVRVELSAEPGRLRVSVRDTGIGIQPAHLPRLFHRFSQAETTTSRRFGGTGLGLAISQRLVEGMGSTIEVESEPGVGTCMHFTLPLAQADATLRRTRHESERPSSHSLRVLVAEDNLINQRVSMGMLQRLGHAPQLVSDGAEAVHQWAGGQFDLILMDLHMPGIDGLEASRRIRLREEAEGRARTPIVALTASALSEERAACLLAGMDDVLSKPLTLDALSKQLKGLDRVA